MQIFFFLGGGGDRVNNWQLENRELERLQAHLHDKKVLGMAQVKMDCLPSRSEQK